VFFLLGFTVGHWESVWLVFLAVPATAIIADIATKNKDLSGSITGAVAIAAAAVFFVLGFTGGYWHPGWMVLLAIPVTAILTGMFRNKGSADSAVGLAAIASVVAFILIGFFVPDSWRLAWLVFLSIPATAIILNIVRVSKKSGEDDNQR